VGPRAGLDGRKISSHRDSIPDRPARSQSLYRLGLEVSADKSKYMVMSRDQNAGRSQFKKNIDNNFFERVEHFEYL